MSHEVSLSGNKSNHSGIHDTPIQRIPFFNPKGVKTASEPFFQKKKQRGGTVKTGLPEQLKTGIENMSRLAMDDVSVNYNSDKPQQLDALAYAQGTDIYIAPGQEQHLAHEAWHVVQQKQGRVHQKEGGLLNDDNELEKEADVMGAKALATAEGDTGGYTLQHIPLPEGDTMPIQRMKAGQLADKHIGKWFSVHLGPDYGIIIGKYQQLDHGGFYWFRGKNREDGNEYQFSVGSGYRVVPMPYFTGYGGDDGFGESSLESENESVDMEEELPIPDLLPPKKLILDTGKGRDENDEKRLNLNDSRAFRATRFFQELDIQTSKVLLMVMDQINNWSLITESFIDKATVILMSAKALHLAEEQTKTQLEQSGATILPITNTDDVWDEQSQRVWQSEHAHLHIKSMILHNQQTNSLVTLWGSGNWTQSGLFKNAEFLIVDRRPEAARAELLALNSYLAVLNVSKYRETQKKSHLQEIINGLLTHSSPLPDEQQPAEKRAKSVSDTFMKNEFGAVKQRNRKEFINTLIRLEHYYMIADDTMALYTLPHLNTKLEKMDTQRLQFDIAFLIKSMLNTAVDTITISSMSMFGSGDNKKDVVLEKIAALLAAKKDLQLKLLLDKNNVDDLITALDEYKLAYNIYGTGQPVQQENVPENQINVYVSGEHTGNKWEQWSFHSKIMVIDDKAALLTTANFMFGGLRGGGGKALNKYYYTKNNRMITQTMEYINSYIAPYHK